MKEKPAPAASNQVNQMRERRELSRVTQALGQLVCLLVSHSLTPELPWSLSNTQLIHLDEHAPSPSLLLTLQCSLHGTREETLYTAGEARGQGGSQSNGG